MRELEENRRDCRGVQAYAWLGLVFLTAGWMANAQPQLTLDEYLNQVRTKNLGVKASQQAAEGAKARGSESALLYAPQLFAETKWLDDKRPQLNPAAQGTRQQAGVYQLGVSKQTRFGLKGRLYSELDTFKISGASPALLPTPTFDEGHQALELTQSLLRNGFGSEVRATETALDAAAEAKGLGETFKIQATLAQAEAAYWRLSAARAAVAVKEESLERATKLRDWNRRRAALELGKRSDLLQAEAAVKLAELDLQSARHEARMAAWAFNTARNESGEEVAEALLPVTAAEAERAAVPPKTGERLDVKAALKQREAADAQAKLAQEKNRPTLDVSGQLMLNARSSGAWEAYKSSFSTDRPTLGAAVKFVLPLGPTGKVNEGYQKEALAAEATYSQKRFEADREWADLERKFNEAKQRLALAVQIEQAQKEKYLNERRRHELGQSTTFQVLSFEQDYAAAQLTTIRLATDVLQIKAQMKLFGGV